MYKLPFHLGDTVIVSSRCIHVLLVDILRKAILESYRDLIKH